MKYLFLLPLIMLHSFANACTEGSDSCNYISMWQDYSKLVVTYAESGEQEGSEFEFFRGDGESFMSFPTQDGKVEIYTIHGYATLWKGGEESGFRSSRECRQILGDTYSIIQSYAVRPLFFLGFGTKKSPEQMGEEVVIAIKKEEDTRVQINPGDHLIIGGPWSLKGTVSGTKNIEYKIFHDFLGKNGQHSGLYVEGSWTAQPQKIPVSPEESVDSWLVCIWEDFNHVEGKSVYTPKIIETSDLKTIKDIRALINK